MNPKLYFDHAATSFPKSEQVVAAVTEYLRNHAGNPGRGVYELSVSAAALIAETRELAARFFSHKNPERIVFQASATHALNQALFGMLRPGDHVVTSNIEHNAVARPLRRLALHGVDIAEVTASTDGRIAAASIAAAVTPKTKMVAVTAGSNLLGARVDLGAIRAAIGPDIFLLVDAAQTAGVLPLDFDGLKLDLLAVPGHKSLGGPAGIGLLLCSDRVELEPLIEGGTGGNSEAPTTPALFPDGYEAGTANGPGIAGLRASLLALLQTDLQATFAQKQRVWQTLVAGLSALPGIEIFSCVDPEVALPLVSFRAKAVPTHELGLRLARDHAIAVRVGLHCTPDAHRVAGTLATGLVRASLGPAHSEADVQRFLAAVASCLAA